MSEREGGREVERNQGQAIGRDGGRKPTEQIVAKDVGQFAFLEVLEHKVILGAFRVDLTTVAMHHFVVCHLILFASSNERQLLFSSFKGTISSHRVLQNVAETVGSVVLAAIVVRILVEKHLRRYSPV